jgi:hypothetical protein
MKDNIFIIAAHALLAAFGALARQLHAYPGGASGVSASSFISGCVIASFMGLMIYFLTRHFEINANIAYAAAGISGWLGPHILDNISRTVTRLAGIDAEGPRETNKKADE